MLIEQSSILSHPSFVAKLYYRAPLCNVPWARGVAWIPKSQRARRPSKPEILGSNPSGPATIKAL